MNHLKEKILIGAQNVIVNNGVLENDLSSLLKQVSISKGNFDVFFKSREDLLSAILDFEAEKLFAKLEELFEHSANPLATLNTFLDWKLKYNTVNGSILAKLGSDFVAKDFSLKKKIKKIYGDYTSYIVRLIEDAVNTGQLNISTPSRELANFIVYSLEGGSISTHLTSSKNQFKDVINMIKRIIRSYRNLETILAI